jgi:hypothetical protein
MMTRVKAWMTEALPRSARTLVSTCQCENCDIDYSGQLSMSLTSVASIQTFLRDRSRARCGRVAGLQVGTLWDQCLA